MEKPQSPKFEHNIIAVGSASPRKHTNAQCGHSVGCFSIKLGGT